MSKFNLLTKLRVQAFNLSIPKSVEEFQVFIYKHKIVDIQKVVLPSWKHPENANRSGIILEKQNISKIRIIPPQVMAYVYYQE
jgi:hypothetical protein